MEPRAAGDSVGSATPSDRIRALQAGRGPAARRDGSLPAGRAYLRHTGHALLPATRADSPLVRSRQPVAAFMRRGRETRRGLLNRFRNL